MDKMGKMETYNGGQTHEHVVTTTTGSFDHDHVMNHMHGGSMHAHDHHGTHHGDMMDNHENHVHSMDGMHGMNEMSHKGHMGMHMPSTFSLTTYSDFMLEGVKISSIQGIILAMVFTVIITIVFDSVKCMMFMRESDVIERARTQVPERKLFSGWYVTSIYHTISMILAYLMMLCVMTMNAWLLVSVILGSGIGYFFIRPLLSWKLGRMEHLPGYGTNPTTEEETKPLYGVLINEQNGELICEQNETEKILDRESVI